MTDHNLKSLPVDELWSLHETVVAELSRKLAAERARLDERLRQLRRPVVVNSDTRPERRPYPKVLPKYCNPKDRSETWQDVESSHVGSPLSFPREKSSMIFVCVIR